MNDLLFKYLTILDTCSSASKSALTAKISSAYRAEEKNFVLLEGIDSGFIEQTKIPTNISNPRKKSFIVYYITDKGREAMINHTKFLEGLLKNRLHEQDKQELI